MRVAAVNMLLNRRMNMLVKFLRIPGAKMSVTTIWSSMLTNAVNEATRQTLLFPEVPDTTLFVPSR